MTENAVIIGLVLSNDDTATVDQNLSELEFLAKTCGANVVKQFTQKLQSPNPSTFLGKGKLKIILDYVNSNAIDLLIFDDDLSATQLRNIENYFKIKILDRSNLILDIFAKRAQTATAKTQVELAQYEYLLPRLTRMWTHLERQKGGIGMRGPGETEIETDRRIVRDKISLLKKKLGSIDRQMSTQRGNRGSLVRVALVGYTNVGKSTIMNCLGNSNVFAENKLFATLDTTVRKVVIRNLPFLLSDTVGFIRKLPTQLVESFKSTLDEVLEADLLLHIVDISHSQFEQQIDSVNLILSQIKASHKPMLLIFNKIDNYSPDNYDETDLIIKRDKRHYTLDEWEQTWMAKNEGNVIFISAIEKSNFEIFKTKLYQIIRQIHISRFPYNHFLYPDS